MQTEAVAKKKEGEADDLKNADWQVRVHAVSWLDHCS